MAKHSRTLTNLCITLFLPVVWAVSAGAETEEKQKNVFPKYSSSNILSTLSREIAFVRSFSASYPCQFRQGLQDPGRVAGAGDENIIPVAK